jgi:hypothetical protein
LSSNNEECLLTNTVAKTTPGQSDHAERLLTAARLHLYSPPQAPKIWGQIVPNLNHYHSDPMEISSTLWILHITILWCQHEEIHSKHTDLSNVVGDILSIIGHSLRVEARFSLWLHVIGCRQSKTTGESLRQKVTVRQFARANNTRLAGDIPVSDSTNNNNDSEMKNETEEGTLHTMVRVYDMLKMWQGSQHLCAAQKESRAQQKQITVVGYILNTEEIVKASWSLCQYNGVAAFKLSQNITLGSSVVCKELPGRTKSNVGCPQNLKNQP